MKLEQFKKGDLIHRTKPRVSENSMSFMSMGSGKSEDYSFVEEYIEVIDMKSGLLFYKYPADNLLKEIYSTSIERHSDDCWDYFPKEYIKKKKNVQ